MTKYQDLTNLGDGRYSSLFSLFFFMLKTFHNKSCIMNREVLYSENSIINRIRVIKFFEDALNKAGV